MAATVIINRLIGENATITACAITSGSARFGTQDTNTSPCATRIPSSGSNYSYWLTTQLNCTAAPDNSLTNIKWYSDGTNSFGTGLQAVVCPASAYASAVGTAGSSGCILNVTNHTGLTGAPSIFTTYTSGNKLTVAGSIAATTGSFGYRVVMQLQVESTATPGNSGEETFTWEWDES